MEPQRPQEVWVNEWERQIANLDQREMEIHQTQLRLLREQTCTFRTDLSTLQQELSGLKVAFSQHVDVVGAKLEPRLQEIADCLVDHAQRHAEADRKFAHLLEQRSFSNERTENIESFTGELCQQHRSLIEEVSFKASQAHAKLEQLHEMCEVSASDVKQSFITLDQRATYLEQVFAMFAEQTKNEFEAAKASATRMTSGVEAKVHKISDAAGLADRVAFIEKAIGEAAPPLARATGDVAGAAAAAPSLGRARGRGRDVEDHLTQLRSLRADITAQGGATAEVHTRVQAIEQVAHEKFAAELEAHKGSSMATFEDIFKSTRSVEDRIVYLERIIGDFAEKHSKEVSSLQQACGTTSTNVRDVTGSVRDVTGKHVALQDRLQYLEKIVGDSAEKHGNAVNSQQAKIEQLCGKITEQEKERAKQGREVSATREELESQHAAIQGHLACVEKAVGESFASHAAELGHLRDAHSKLHSEGRKAEVRTSTFEERLDSMERWLRGFKLPEAVGFTSPSREAALGLRPRADLSERSPRS